MRQSVWHPSKLSHTSQHWSSSLKNAMNLRSMSWESKTARRCEQSQTVSVEADTRNFPPKRESCPLQTTPGCQACSLLPGRKQRWDPVSSGFQHEHVYGGYWFRRNIRSGRHFYSKDKGKNGVGGVQSPLTSGVTALRWVTRAGTDTMWMRNSRIRLSENCAASTGLDTNRSPHSGGLYCEPGTKEQSRQHPQIRSRYAS